MSRIGKTPVTLPAGVTAALAGQQVEVTGPNGKLSFTVADEVKVELDGSEVKLTPTSDSKRSRQLWGMSRTMVNNCVEGVNKGFQKELLITGVGYRAEIKKDTGDLRLTVGLSHDVTFSAFDGMEITTPAPTRIRIKGIDKQKVGQLAAEIRAVRPPEPYKGKGIRYANENILRKVGKKK